MTPHAPEIEAAILGAILTNGEKIEQAKVDILPEMFFDPINQAIYTAMLKCNSVDALSVIEQLKRSGQLEKIGGMYAVTNLLTSADIYGNIKEHIAILKQKYTRREAIQIGSLLQQIGADETRDELDAFQGIDDAHVKLSQLLFGTKQAETFEDIAAQSLVELRERIERHKQGGIPGITTGILELDKITGGWNKGDLIVLAGRPGMGKTALALHFLTTAANNQTRAYIFSLEMTNTRLADRVIIGGSQVDGYKYRMGSIDEKELDQVSGWTAAAADMPIFMDEKSYITVDYIVARTKMMKRRNAIDIVIIDYLQLIDMQQAKGATRDQAIGMVTRKLKAMAKELNIPVILLSQLNRMVEDRAYKRPSLRDLRESGNIEQDADLVLFAYRPAYYDIKEHEGKDTDGLIIIDIAKHRNGESNIDVEFYHNESLTRFFDEKTLPF